MTEVPHNSEGTVPLKIIVRTCDAYVRTCDV